jgi:hypothetical protein
LRMQSSLVLLLEINARARFMFTCGQNGSEEPLESAR